MNKLLVALGVLLALVGGAALFVSPVGWGKGRQPIAMDVVSPNRIGRGWRRG